MNIVTVNDLAHLTGLTPRHIRRLCANGTITAAIKAGRDWVLPADQLQAALRVIARQSEKFSHSIVKKTDQKN